MGVGRYKRKWIRRYAAGFPTRLASRACAEIDIAREFQKRLGYRPNIRRPSSFNEKIQWRKLYDHNPLYTVFSDKWRVRDYVRQHADGDLLNEAYFIGGDPGEIPFNDLPRRFVVKATHGSGWTLPVRDKREVAPDGIRALCRSWLGARYGRQYYEWAYHHVPPQILVEEFVRDPDTSVGAVPRDYKLYVFSGRVRLIQVDIDCDSRPSKALFDPDWRYLDIQYNYPKAQPLPQPARLGEMKTLAEELAATVDFARVDLYQAADGIRFGEITVYPNSGYAAFRPQAWDHELGRWWQPGYAKPVVSAAAVRRRRLPLS